MAEKLNAPNVLHHTAVTGRRLKGQKFAMMTFGEKSGKLPSECALWTLKYCREVLEQLHALVTH